MRSLFLLALVALGCTDGVREDRSINWSEDGRIVAFQHGADGVYVADANGGPTRVLGSAADTIATSSPLWAPDGRRLIFSTAVADGNAAPAVFALGAPAGALHHVGPVRYTCWLRDGDAEPVALFSARCGHAGYVAANLATRWGPDGSSIYFVHRTDQDRHGLSRYAIATKRTARVPVGDAPHLVFDFSPDGRHLACARHNLRGDEICVVSLNGEGAWRIPSEPPPPEESRDAGSWHALATMFFPRPAGDLTRLRGLRPAWTPDGTRFALGYRTSGTCVVAVGDPATRTLETVVEATAPGDLRWRDGNTFGFVDAGTLRIVGAGGAATIDTGVRRFAGWNAAGTRIAYTKPAGVANAQNAEWAVLLGPDPAARDALYVRTGDGPATRVLDDVRVTFPQWSPRDDELSLWFTFMPTHPSLVSGMFGWRLGPGDPAATYRPETRTVRWLAVNDFEREQIGHIHLLRGENEAAWRRYEESAGRLEDPGLRPADRATARFFRHVCLARLGRHEDATRMLAAFDETALDGDSAEGATAMRDVLATEIYLSLDDADGAEAYLARGPSTAAREALRGQLRLLRGDRNAYVRHAHASVLPLLERTTRGEEDASESERFIAYLAMLPLLCNTFVVGLPEEEGDLARTAAARVRALEKGRPLLGSMDPDDALSFVRGLRRAMLRGDG